MKYLKVVFLLLTIVSAVFIQASSGQEVMSKKGPIFVIEGMVSSAVNDKPSQYSVSVSSPTMFSRGQDFKVWITARVRAHKNPCPPGGSEKCKFESAVVDADKNYDNVNFNYNDRYVDGETHFEYWNHVAQNSVPGKKLFVFRVKYSGKVLQTISLPVEIKE